MYPHSDGGYRQFPALVEFASYTGPQSNSDYTKLIASQVTTPISHMYNRDGSKLYVLDTGGTLYQYSCSTYGAPTVYDGLSLDLTTEDATPAAVLFVPSDYPFDEFYMLGATNNRIYGYFSDNGSSDLDHMPYADLSNPVPDITGTLEDFSTYDGINWIFTSNSRTHYHTSSTWQMDTLVLDTEFDLFQEVSTFDSTGTSFLSDSEWAFTTPEPYDLGNAVNVNSLGTNLRQGLPNDGSKQNLSFKFTRDDLLTMTGTSGGEAFFASLTIQDGALVSSGSFLGGEVMGGVPYLLLGGSLLAFDSSGKWKAYRQAGVSGDDRTVSDTDGTNIVFTNGEFEYLFNLTDGFERILDSDLGEAASTAYLDSTFYYPVGDRIYASDLADPSSVEALNFITAESFADRIIRNFTINQLHYSFGSKTIEIHFTSGQGNTRLSRQAVLEHGIIGTHAIDSIDDTIYFIDAERRLSRIRGFEYAPLVINGLGEEFNSYSTVDDCIVSAFTFEQQNFIEVTFPTADVTWVIHEPSGEVVKREDTNGDRSRSAYYMNVYGNTYSVDHTNGKVYEYSDTVFQDDGSAIGRTLFSRKIESELLGFSAREFTLDAIYIEHDVSASTDLIVSVSFDSGETFEMEQTVTVDGNGIERLPNFGMASEVIVKITTNSNTRADILGLSVEAEPLDD